MGGFISLDELAIGTLSAFILVSIAVMVLQVKQPDLPRAFRCPAVPLVPGLGLFYSAVSCFFSQGAEMWIRFLIWLAIGFAIYFGYSRKHSKLN